MHSDIPSVNAKHVHVGKLDAVAIAQSTGPHTTTVTCLFKIANVAGAEWPGRSATRLVMPYLFLSTIYGDFVFGASMITVFRRDEDIRLIFLDFEFERCRYESRRRP